MRGSHGAAGPDRIAGIDALRAVAVLAVVAYHLEPRWLPGGFAGVDVFFVISGYVVTRALAAHVGEPWPTFLAGFYARRVRRIVPALVACIGIVLVLDTLFVPQAWLSSQNFNTARSALVGLSNVFLESHREGYFSPRIEFNPYAHTWSLGVEEQFYAFLPLLYFAARRRRDAPDDAALRWIGGLGIASLAWSAGASALAPADAYYALPSRFWELAIGACLAERHRTRGSLFVPHAAMRTALLLLLGAGLWWPRRDGFPIPWALPAVVASALLIDGLHVADVPRRLRAPAILYVGRVSYSLYLWHWPVFSLARWTRGLDDAPARAVALALVALLSAASYHGVEQVFQRARRVPPRFAIATAALAVVAGLVAASMLHANADRVSLSVTRDARTWYADDRSSSSDAVGCHGVQHRTIVHDEAVITIRRTGCDDAVPRPTLFVLGDSHATAYLGLLGRLVAEHPVDVELRARAGCAFFALDTPVAEGPADCARFVDDTLRIVAARATRHDSVFLPGLRLERLVDQWGGTAPRAAVAPGAAAVARERAVADAIARLRPLTAAGVDVVFEAPKPLFAAPAFRCADWFDRDNAVCRPGFTMDAAFLRTYREPVMRQLATIEAALPGVRTWDPFDALCPGPTCSAFAATTPLFYDADHLSGFGADLLYPGFVSFVASRPDAGA